jgi:hypothetical protein
VVLDWVASEAPIGVTRTTGPTGPALGVRSDVVETALVGSVLESEGFTTADRRPISLKLAPISALDPSE